MITLKRLIILICFTLLAIISETIASNEDYFKKGNDLTIQGQYPDAIIFYDLAIKHKPDHFEAYFNKSIALNKLGKLQEAMVSLDLAIKYKPDFAEAYYNKGHLL